MRCYFDYRGLHCELIADIISYPGITTEGSISFFYPSILLNCSHFRYFCKWQMNYPQRLKTPLWLFSAVLGLFYVCVRMSENGR